MPAVAADAYASRVHNGHILLADTFKRVVLDGSISVDALFDIDVGKNASITHGWHD